LGDLGARPNFGKVKSPERRDKKCAVNSGHNVPPATHALCSDQKVVVAPKGGCYI
jgi:hypothetical protein